MFIALSLTPTRPKQEQVSQQVHDAVKVAPMMWSTLMKVLLQSWVKQGGP